VIISVVASLLGAEPAPAQVPGATLAWRAGMATTVITPKENMWMAG
jgi:hypothetical protein